MEHNFVDSEAVEVVVYDSEFTVVNLGNHGYDEGSFPFFESLRLARHHPSWKVIGIDILDGKYEPVANFIQIKGDFISGLNSIKGLVKRISSTLALGYYDEIELQSVHEGQEIDLKSDRYSYVVNYTKEVLNACYDKLVKNGSLVVVVSENGKAVINEAISGSKFSKSDLFIKKLNPKKSSKTHWMRVFQERDQVPLYRLRIRK